MVAVKVNAFGGMIPATDSRLIPDHAATVAQNCWLYSGELKGLVAPTLVKALAGTTKKVYRIPNSFTDFTFGNATFMEFADPNTDVVPSTVVGDTYSRYYWASPTGVPQLNSLARIQASLPPYSLGLNPPATISSIAITGGTSASVTRAYVTTFVTAFGEEGPPSTPVLATGFSNATWTINLTPPSAGDVTQYNIAYINIYRTVTGSNGVASYFQVGIHIAQTSTSFPDFGGVFTDATIALNPILPSATWVAPPTNLQGLTALPNGILAGFEGNNIHFCEPYRPHAWPAQYSLAVNSPIVGLGVINQTLVILTAAYPMQATGINPASMTLSTLASLEPCLSRGSIVSAPEGVYYTSPNGLVLVANSAAQNITQGLLQKDDWNTFLTQPTLRAARLGNISYYAFSAGSMLGALIDPTTPRVAFGTVTSATNVDNVFNDSWSGEALMITNSNLYRIDIANETSARMPFTWTSKQFQPMDRKNFAAVRVYFEVPPWAPAGHTALTRSTAFPQTLQATQFGLVSIYADGTLVMTRELVKSGELMKIPSGFKADYWQISVTGYVKVMSVQMATSDKELRKV